MGLNFWRSESKKHSKEEEEEEEERKAMKRRRKEVGLEKSDGIISKNILGKDFEKDEHDFIVVNFANPDMVGHTGNLTAATKAIEVVKPADLPKLVEILRKVSKEDPSIIVNTFCGLISGYNVPREDQCVRVYPRTVWDFTQEIVKIRPLENCRFSCTVCTKKNETKETTVTFWFDSPQ